ncbi:MAG: gliding motility lipoprotein GldH [Dysgonamonadaceae bacterium]|jgi:gliding motility-associated lipoprotein GldH|nr:gliding motility lipoprotein GldH [Dysgonamonadaceae bacterium]
MKCFSALCVVLGSLLFLAGCNEGEAFFRFRPIENAAWEKNAPVVFELDSLGLNPDKSYDISIEITTDATYPYRNIWLFIGQNVQDSLLRSDSLDIQLADTNGKWLGNGVGGLHQLSVPYIRSARFDSTTFSRLQIRQGMQDETLKGVERLGLEIRTTGDK